MEIKVLLCVGRDAKNAPTEDTRHPNVREAAPYFSHWEQKCIHCRSDWAADSVEDFDKPCSADCTADEHVWSDPKPVFYSTDGSRWAELADELPAGWIL